MNANFLIFTYLLLAIPVASFATEESMKQMPIIKPKNSYSVQSTAKGENLLDQRGFGDQEPMVRMMNLMMVQGSGYEGMDMDAMNKMDKGAAQGHQMKVATDETTKVQSPEGQPGSLPYDIKIKSISAKVGPNPITISVSDAKTGKPKKGLKLKAQVYMTSMDMGTEEPRVREISPGEYQVKASFAMKGPWALKLILPDGEKIFNFDVVAKP
jgi:hypothetical protein